MSNLRNWLAGVMTFTILLGSGLVAGAAPGEVENEHFQRVWDRTDRPVAENAVDRTWIWGAAISEEMSEPYSDAPSGERTVQYFDKSRMEITHPDSGDPASPWYVTNGLLVRELITGWVQVGNAAYEPGLSSEMNVAGDQGFPTGPSYATFRHLLDTYVSAPGDQSGEIVVERMDRSGTVAEEAGLAEQGVTLAHFDDVTGHNIAAPFWNFMNSTGLIYGDAGFSEATLFENPYYATGRPLIEPYWSDVTVAGTEKLVLIQCFERRCLTYTPDNPEGWQVEAGNVGQHYYEWRYGEFSQTAGQLLFLDDIFDEDTNHHTTDIFTINADGTGRVNLTSELDAWVSIPVWSPDGERIAFAADGDLYVMDADGTNLIQITTGDAVDEDPDWSPDGSRIAFERTLSDQITQIFVVNADGSDEYQLTTIPPEVDTSASRDPVWSPDGERIAFVNFNGTVPPPLPATLYLIHADGSGLQPLVISLAITDPEWSPDGTELIYERQATGDHDLSGGSIHGIDLTEDPVKDTMIIGEDSSFPHQVDLSPHGNRLAMIKKAPGYNGAPLGIHTVDLDGENVRQLTHYGMGPDWAPGGDAITFSMWTTAPDMSGYMSLIGVVSADGSSLNIVTSGYAPLWRP